MKPVLLLFLTPLFLISCYNPTTDDNFENLRHLDGSWESYKGVKFKENWRYMDENVFEGEGFSLNGTDTSFFETLRIIRSGDSIYYRVSFPEEKSIVDFLLTDASDRRWKFVNTQNDFPAIIEYQIEKDTLLQVTIANIRGNKKQYFYLKKIN